MSVDHRQHKSQVPAMPMPYLTSGVWQLKYGAWYVDSEPPDGTLQNITPSPVDPRVDWYSVVVIRVEVW
jgi:hypothetical protein